MPAAAADMRTPCGGTGFPVDKCRSRQSQPAETKNVPAQKPPQEVRFFMEAASAPALFRNRGIAKEGVSAASLAAKIPASQGNHSNLPPQDVQVRLLGQAHRMEKLRSQEGPHTIGSGDCRKRQSKGLRQRWLGRRGFVSSGSLPRREGPEHRTGSGRAVPRQGQGRGQRQSRA